METVTPPSNPVSAQITRTLHAPPRDPDDRLDAATRDRDSGPVRSDADATSAPVPRHIGRFAVLGTLGRGGMGTVYEAFDRALDRRVAVKVLHRDVDPDSRMRLVREAQALAKLSHPNVVHVHEVGEVDGQAFVAMELVRGKTLKRWSKQEPRPDWRACLEVYGQAGEGLAAAHRQGLVHRDFKPSNAVLDDEGRVRVLDFGLARAVDEEPASGVEGASGIVGSPLAESSGRSTDVRVTATGAVMGTPAYMPLEQMAGGVNDARSDQFSFCVALFRAVYGTRPYPGKSLTTLRASLEDGEVQPTPHATAIPSRLRPILVRGLARSPEDRWPSMDILLAELARLRAPRPTRRWQGPTVGLVVGLGLVGAGLAYQGEQRCTDAEARLEGIWGEAQRDRVRDSILATARPYTDATWARVRDGLDAYAERWAARHTAVCEATSVRREQSDTVMELRMGCLRRRRDDLRATVEVLARDETPVLNATQLVDSLPPLDNCDDVPRLTQRSQRVPPPDDPQVSGRVEVMRATINDARSLREAGLYADASKLIEALVEPAQALGYPPLEAEIRMWRGRTMADNGQYPRAAQELRAAHALAVEHDHEQVELGTSISLAAVVGEMLAKPEAGLVWGRGAVALAKRLGTPVDLARTLSALSGVERFSDPAAAETMLRTALRLREQALGPEHRLVAKTVNELGVLLQDEGRFEEAQAELERALNISSATLGPDHPQVATALNGLGAVLVRRGRPARAQPLLRRALEIQRRGLGPDHPAMAASLNNLAIALSDQGKLDEAEQSLQQALQIRQRAHGPQHPLVGDAFNNLAMLMHQRGEAAEAERLLRRALVIWENAHGSEHRDVAGAQFNLAMLLENQGHADEARPLYRQAVETWEATLGPRHEDVALGLVGYGTALRRNDQLEPARAKLQRALDILEPALRPDHPRLANPLVELALVEHLQDNDTAATAYAQRAVSIREATAAGPRELAWAYFVLARSLWSNPVQRQRALSLASNARTKFAGLGEAGRADVAEIDHWLAIRRRHETYAH